ncbi:hypothetical protein PR202_ga12980 [Eleusine coracana subsp. coracana]|uniref:Uncharacterized protein n=1 Tax=Eleusine coracana subsp. coracana TaxID=191504 RepID=A0AAV5CDM4_ELECO|nr:hypothetical protein PR202_ga12980 [Eleusine coracana subsp. coracana]
MCFQVKCETCGKSTWAGCGRHVASVHAQVPEGQHCACRDWPGVVVPAVEKKKAAATKASAEGSADSTKGAGAAHLGILKFYKLRPSLSGESTFSHRVPRSQRLMGLVMAAASFLLWPPFCFVLMSLLRFPAARIQHRAVLSP